MVTTLSRAVAFHSTFTSPLGELILISNGEALTGLLMNEPGEGRDPRTAAIQDEGPFREIQQQLEAYFDGERTDFDIPLNLSGTPFQRRVWEELRRIPYGSTISYGELARRVGQPGASRAVGSANGRNQIGIIIPCHRVIASDGTLGGYGGGLDRKEWLLRHEAKVLRNSKR